MSDERKERGTGSLVRRPREPHTGYWLQHMVNGKSNGRFVMTHVGKEPETILDTGSGVLVLKMLRKLRLSTPDIMGGPKCFETEWMVGW